MKDRSFTCYRTRASYLGGEVKDGCLHIESEVYGDGDRYLYDVEAIYDFSKTMTDKLFALISINDFIELCRAGRVRRMESFLKDNGIECEKFTHWTEHEARSRDPMLRQGGER